MVFNIFAANLHAGRGAIDMKRIKRDFSLNALFQSPVVGQCQNNTFSEYGHAAYQIKADDACSNILPSDTPSTPWVGANGQTIFF